MKTSELCAIVTDRVLQNLEKAGSWAKLWNAPSPISINGYRYRGINFLMLADDRYELPIWGTFQQLRSNGGRVKAGEKATMIVFWDKLYNQDEDPKTDPGHFFLKQYYVFNIAQAEFDEAGTAKIEQLKQDVLKMRDNKTILSAESIVENFVDPPQIIHGTCNDIAGYEGPHDRIFMPDRRSFVDSDEYYCTLFHELIHSTGHEKRLNRKYEVLIGNKMENYSKEELVAELGASFLASLSGINWRIENSAAYIKSWSSLLKDNTRWILWAASKAEQAVNHITGVHAEVVAA